MDDEGNAKVYYLNEHPKARASKQPPVEGGKLIYLATERAIRKIPKPVRMPRPVVRTLTAKAVAMQLGCDVSTVYKLARQGLIPHERFGKLLVRFPVDTVEIMMGKKESQEDKKED